MAKNKFKITKTKNGGMKFSINYLENRGGDGPINYSGYGAHETKKTQKTRDKKRQEERQAKRGHYE